VSPTEVKEKARRIARRETLGAYGKRWIAERCNSSGEPLRALTRKDYESTLAKLIAPTLGRMHIDEITRADVRQWYVGLAEAGVRSRTKAYGLLRAIMNPPSTTNSSRSRRCTSVVPAPRRSERCSSPQRRRSWT